MSKSLYLCYFGLREPLVQTQVLPYLREIKKGGTAVSILTFETNPKERWTPEQIDTERAKLAAEGIEWDFLTYHKRPSAPATLFDVLCGALFAWRKARRENIDILHARVHTPAMMGALAKKFLRRKPKLLFDIRGFFPEEYTDAGIWPADGILYKTVKRIEKWLLRESDGFIVLTEKAREIMFPESAQSGADKLGRPVEMIPCCIDEARFRNAGAEVREQVRAEMNVGSRNVLIYVGSYGGWYLTDEMLDFFVRARLKDPSMFMLVLTPRDHEKLAASLAERGVPPEDFMIRSVPPADVPKYLCASDVAISFIKACYSKQSSSPTKIAEYLAVGLPVVSNSGVGDLDSLIEDNKLGVILSSLSTSGYDAGLAQLDELMTDPALSERCAKVAADQFDLGCVAGERYRRMYFKLLNE